MISVTVLATVYLAVMGLAVGSFLNVVIERLHSGEQFTGGRSHCDHCKHVLRWWELVPVFSWLLLRGRCAKCRRSLSIQHPAVELSTGAVFAALYLYVRPGSWIQILQLLLWLYIGCSLIILFVYDLKWYLLPDKVLLPLIVPALLLGVTYALNTHSWHVLIGPVFAGFVFGGGFLGLAVVSKGKWMGGGDIKLAFVMGLLLGLQKTAFAMLLAFNGAALIMVPLLAAGKLKPRSHIPFGPFLIFGTIASLLVGGPVIDWYITVNGLR